MKNITRFIMLVAIGFALGPELFVFMPEAVFLIEVLGLEFIVLLLISGLTPIRNYFLIGLQAIRNNRHLKNIAMIVLLVALAPIAPELLILIDAVGIELAFTGMLIHLRSQKVRWGQSD